MNPRSVRSLSSRQYSQWDVVLCPMAAVEPRAGNVGRNSTFVMKPSYSAKSMPANHSSASGAVR